MLLGRWLVLPDASALRGEGFLEWKEGGCRQNWHGGPTPPGLAVAVPLISTRLSFLPKDQVRFLSFCETELLTSSKGWTSGHWAFWSFYGLAWDWCCPWWVPSRSSWAWCCVGRIHGRHTYHLLFPSWKGHIAHLEHSQSVEQWLAQIQLIF